MQPRSRLVLAALAFSIAGCAAFHPQPLKPEDELGALRRHDLAGFVVERARPGERAAPSDFPFDPSDGLDERELVAVALTLNPGLRAKRLETGEAQAALITAGLWPNPDLGVSWRTGVGGASGSNVAIDLLVELLKPWERRARKEVAVARIEEAKAGLIAEEWRLVADVRSQLLATLVAEHSLRLLEEEGRLREHVLRLAQRRVELGEGTKLDVSVAELDFAQVRQDARRAQAELGTARRNLNLQLGLPPELPVRLVEFEKPFTVTLFAELSDDELEQRLVAGRFELRAKESAYQKAEQELRLAVYQQFPGLKLGPSFERELGGDKSLGLGVALELPVFDRKQGEIAEKASQRDRLRAEYAALLHRLKAAAYEARAQLQAARLEVEFHEKETLPLATRSQALFEAAFRARELSVLDWLTAQQRTLRARRDYLESLGRYRQAVIHLEAATGMPLTQAPGSSEKRGS